MIFGLALAIGGLWAFIAAMVGLPALIERSLTTTEGGASLPSPTPETEGGQR